jgi:hypothetical protein
MTDRLDVIAALLTERRVSAAELTRRWHKIPRAAWSTLHRAGCWTDGRNYWCERRADEAEPGAGLSAPHLLLLSCWRSRWTPCGSLPLMRVVRKRRAGVIGAPGRRTCSAWKTA